MKLYVLRHRSGSLVSSLTKPWGPSEAEKAEVQEEIAAIPGWLEIPYGVGQSGYPTLKQFMEMAFYYHMLHVFTWGVVHSQAVMMTNAALAKWVALSHAAALAGTVFLAVVVLAVVLAIMWYLTPSAAGLVSGPVFPPRYIIAYRERLWWADFIGKDSEGRPYYVLCSPTGAVRMTERQNVWFGGQLLDFWTLGGSWVQRKHEFLNYKEWRWDEVFVDFVGYCYMSAEFVWCLKEPYIDKYAGAAPPGYVVPVPWRCKDWLVIP
ncbi:hypothetical protein ES707_15318 [subsurface metagenome]